MNTLQKLADNAQGIDPWAYPTYQAAVNRALADLNRKARLAFRKVKKPVVDTTVDTTEEAPSPLLASMTGHPGAPWTPSWANQPKQQGAEQKTPTSTPTASALLSAISRHPVAAGLGAAGTLAGVGTVAALLARRRAERSIAEALAQRAPEAFGGLGRLAPWLGGGLLAGYLLGRRQNKQASALPTVEELIDELRSGLEKLGFNTINPLSSLPVSSFPAVKPQIASIFPGAIPQAVAKPGVNPLGPPGPSGRALYRVRTPTAGELAGYSMLRNK